MIKESGELNVKNFFNLISFNFIASCGGGGGSDLHHPQVPPFLASGIGTGSGYSVPEVFNQWIQNNKVFITKRYLLLLFLLTSSLSFTQTAPTSGVRNG